MIKFSTKANTLSLLENRVTKSKVLPQLCFTISDFNKSHDNIYKKVNDRFKVPLIVRSSSISEDSVLESRAGKFLSIQNVSPPNIISAMEKVKNSFDDDNPDNQILIQPMLPDIVINGVIFTLDPNGGGNYFVIEYEKSMYSDRITSGTSKDINTYYIFHGHKSDKKYLNKLIDAAYELITLFNNNSLDIEFAFTGLGQLYLFQVRPLIVKKKVASYNQQKDATAAIYRFLESKMQAVPFCKGKRTIYGIMPDWNPAEIIGVRPKQLAISLYRKVITDSVWAIQRENYGYRNMNNVPLMVDFFGFPYIDTRVSFNSFIPNDIDDNLAEKLVNYYLDSLEANPSKHDKVEFDIVFSCYTFDINEKIKILSNYNFQAIEQKKITNSLRCLTNNIIDCQNGFYIKEFCRIEQLKKKHQQIMCSNLSIIDKIYWLIEDCIKYGTLPFAGLARSGFIAILLLKSLVSIGILSKQNYDDYLKTLNTISSEMIIDKATLPLSTFLEKYGHLRPCTYDITLARYDQAPERYFGKNKNRKYSKQKVKFLLTSKQIAAIQSQIKQQSLNCDINSLFTFIKSGIEGREYAKFIFTKNISDALELISQLGKNYGYSREEMAFVDISVIKDLYLKATNVKQALGASILKGYEKYKVTSTLNLPSLIFKPSDIYSFHLQECEPNFITMNKITANVCFSPSADSIITNKIVMIESADPGFDWLFSYKIAGLITAFGGTNSHMAIRAGELDIPAVIGAGEKLFNYWYKAQTLHIDCPNKKVVIIC